MPTILKVPMLQIVGAEIVGITYNCIQIAGNLSDSSAQLSSVAVYA